MNVKRRFRSTDGVRAASTARVLVFIVAASVALPAAATAQARDRSANDVDKQGPVTREEILENPNDPELNYRYAQQLIDQGAYLRAASSLKRVLYTQPERDRLRLLYGIVLYRLDRIADANYQLETVDAADLPAAERRTLADFRQRVARAQQRVRGSIAGTVGLHYDTNRNNFPDTGEFQVDLPVLGSTTFDAAGSEEDDVGRFLALDGRATFETGLQRLPSVTVQAVGAVDDQVEIDSLDLGSGLARLSTRFIGRGFEVVPAVSYRHVMLGWERYLRRPRGRVRVNVPVDTERRLKVYAEAAAAYEDFAPVERDPTADEQDGRLIEGALGVQYRASERLRLRLAYRAGDKNADATHEAYQDHAVEAAGSYVARPGVTLRAFGTFTHRAYDAPDPVVSTVEDRRDDIYEVGGTLGVTADRIARTLGVSDTGGITDDLLVRLGTRYRRADSNFPNFEYDNVRVQVSVTKKLPF